MGARGPSPRPAIDRVLSRIIVDDHGCWIFQGNKPNGYGLVQCGSASDGTRQPKLTHRVVYEALVGPIADGMQLHHLCGQRACCNPDHLDAIDIVDHQHEHHHHGDTCRTCGSSDWYQRRDGGRQCRTCNRRRKRRAQTECASRLGPGAWG